MKMDHGASTLPGRDVWQVWLANLTNAQQEQPPQTKLDSLVGGFVSNPGAAGDADDCSALELGEAVALPDGRDEGGRRAGVDVVGGEGDHGWSAIRLAKSA